MSSHEGVQPQARTVLEQQIRQRHLSFEEFARYAEEFARKHGEPGTLSFRHLQRLAAGTRSDGRPLGPVRPATARLLERIFGMDIAELLSSPKADVDVYPLRVAVAVVVHDDDVLIVRRRAEDPAGISWQFPAGMVKPDASPATTAVHETFNETGVHCTVIRNLGTRLHPMTRVLCDYLLCEYRAGDTNNADPVENVDALWVRRTELTHFIPAQRLYSRVRESLQLDKTPTG